MTRNLNNPFAGDALKKDLMRKISSGELAPGEPILAERRLAEMYGIGYMTVRRTIEDLVESGMLYREPRKGTFVAERKEPIFKSDSRVIAFIVSDLKNQFSIQLLEAVERKARQHNFHLMVCNSELDITLEASHLRSMSESSVAGIILSPCFPPVNREVVAQVLKRNIPVVLIDKYFPDLDIDCVTCDNYEAAYRAVSYLISLGHRRIAHITSHHSLKQISSIKERFEGYRQALEDHGIEYNPGYVSELEELSVHTEMSKINLNYLGYGPMKKLLSQATPPEAVFMLFDQLAIGAYRALREEGLRIPGDISLIGFNNDELCAYLDTPLTTMSQPLREIGETAFAILHDRIGGRVGECRHEKIRTQLIERNSCQISAQEKVEQAV